MKTSTQWHSILLLSLAFPLWPASAQSETPHSISHEIVGRKVWINECDGKVAGLTSWNGDEAFPSLGIGHFIWYPAGEPGPFEESFPLLIAYLKERGIELPEWLSPLGPCPWPSRRAFMADFNGPRLSGLRKFLASTVAEQNDFLFERLRLFETQLSNGLDAQDAARLKRNFQLLSESTAVPDALKVAPTETLLFSAHAKGVQIYTWLAKKDDPTKFEWVFKSPEADLFDAQDKKIGRHYAGPTWESTDGSKVIGELKGHNPSTDASAITWLLLSAKAHEGNGIFSHVTTIQRLETVGGKAPAVTDANQPGGGKELRVPYTAVYYFYGLKS